jgi:hypothetical protein
MHWVNLKRNGEKMVMVLSPNFTGRVEKNLNEVIWRPSEESDHAPLSYKSKALQIELACLSVLPA